MVTTSTHYLERMVTRVPVMGVRPQIEGGRFPVKAVPDEEFTVRARVFGEGDRIVRAAVILTGPDGRDRPSVRMSHLDNDHWAATVSADSVGPWTFRVESWHDPIAAWVRDAQVRFAADVDVEVTLAEGATLLRRGTAIDPACGVVADDMVDTTSPAIERLATALTFVATFDRESVRDHVGASDRYPVFVDRERALVGSWYTMFPRSEGAERRFDGSAQPGTLRTAAKRLEAVAAMGFDIVALPPVHPIGESRRLGRDHAAPARVDDPGSPWAIGSRDGGHDAVHPDLGTFDDFDAFVERAHQLGLEVALDLALQCSPDHPWVTEHPEWFTIRPDGSIARADNSPTSFDTVYALDFDNDPDNLYYEVLRIVAHWIDHGIRIFRVDHPQTAPLRFWERLLADVRDIDVDVLFLAEAFTDPAMLHALAAVGFHQSATYFIWREHADETSDYLDEVSNHSSDLMRPNFFVNTPDILPRYLQDGEQSMFRARAVLAATGSPSWGMYAGYELMEHEPAGTDTEEYLHSEKYEIKVRDWDDPWSLAPFISRLNEIRRDHPALQRLRNLVVHRTNQTGVIAFSKRRGDDAVLVVVDLFPAFGKAVGVDVDAAAFGLPADTDLTMRDEIDGTHCSVGRVPLSNHSPARILTYDRS
ncbi:maltotransferase domain-containing protein [Aeromicrobium sp.]|uniref:maltotransferase domain-containing protein n=1 Tax=Aeromicrobium sp. TaxID=1871063 RepID=UPI003C704FBA